MSEVLHKLETPSCEVTGLPLPILPNEPQNEARFYSPPNWHHHFHPSTSPHLLLESPGGYAVRRSRIQKIDYTLHNNYHRIFEGPELPESRHDAFRSIIIAAAGAIPRQALDVSVPGEFKIVTMPTEVHREIAESGHIKVDAPKIVAEFIADYAASQKVEDLIDGLLIEEFLDENTLPKRKRMLASYMLSHALELSVAPLGINHKELKVEGYLAQKKTVTVRRMAKTIVRRHSMGRFSAAMQERFLPVQVA